MGTFRNWFENEVTQQKDQEITGLFHKVIQALGIGDGIKNPLAVAVSDIVGPEGRESQRGNAAVLARLAPLAPDINKVMGADKMQSLQQFLKTDKETDHGRAAGSGMLSSVLQQIFPKDMLERLSRGDKPVDPATAQVPMQPPVDQTPPQPDNGAAPQPQPDTQGMPPAQPGAPPAGAPPQPGVPMPGQPDPNQQPMMAHHRPQGRGIFEQWMAKRNARR